MRHKENIMQPDANQIVNCQVFLVFPQRPDSPPVKEQYGQDCAQSHKSHAYVTHLPYQVSLADGTYHDSYQYDYLEYQYGYFLFPGTLASEQIHYA